MQIGSLEGVDLTDPTLFCYSNSLQLQISKETVEDNEWLNSQACESTPGSGIRLLYISADSKSKRDEWFERLETLCNKKAAANSGEATKVKTKQGNPMLPPRK